MDREKMLDYLKYFAKEAYDWRIGDEILGIPWKDFVSVMESAAEYIERREPDERMV